MLKPSFYSNVEDVKKTAMEQHEQEHSVGRLARPRMLFFFRGAASSETGLSSTLRKSGWMVDQEAVADEAPLLGVWQILRRRDWANYDVVAAAEYFLTWAACLRLLVVRGRPKVAALGFNQSRRLLLTGFRPVDWLLNRIWRRASLFLVHSQDEASLFERAHEIPADRFVFSHWGYDLPAHDPAVTPLPAGPYVTMIGRNNRDLETFCAAVNRAGVKGVLITADYMLERSPVKSDNVVILADRSMEECLNYIAGCFAHLVLVADGRRGAGHISAVSAMLLSKPQIFSDVAPIADYLTDGFNGIAVPVGDVDSVATAIVRLRDDRGLAQMLGQNGRKFAEDNLSYDASEARTIEALERLAGG